MSDKQSVTVAVTPDSLNPRPFSEAFGTSLASFLKPADPEVSKRVFAAYVLKGLAKVIEDGEMTYPLHISWDGEKVETVGSVVVAKPAEFVSMDLQLNPDGSIKSTGGK
jgi:hypothetical protein